MLEDIEATLTLRNADVQDAVEIAALYNYYIEHSCATFEETPLTPEQMGSRMDAVAAKQLPWIVAECEQGVVGFAYAAWLKDRTAYRFAVETTIYLKNGIASKGLGTRLYAELFKALRARNIRTAIGIIALPNQASVALHEKFCMTKAAHLKEVGFKFNTWIDVGYWQCLL